MCLVPMLRLSVSGSGNNRHRRIFRGVPSTFLHMNMLCLVILVTMAFDCIGVYKQAKDLPDS